MKIKNALTVKFVKSAAFVFPAIPAVLPTNVITVINVCREAVRCVLRAIRSATARPEQEPTVVEDAYAPMIRFLMTDGALNTVLIPRANRDIHRHTTA